MTTLTVGIGIGIIIVLMEGTLWWIFRSKITGLVFPREMDASLFRFFSITRLRLFAALHAIFLIGASVLLLALFW